MESSSGPIAIEASKCRQSLNLLCRELEQLGQGGGDGQIPEGLELKHLRDCLDRFNIWAGSLGAYQKGLASLDSRISHDDLAEEVIRLLKQLSFFISELEPIVHGNREQLTWSKASLRISFDEVSDDDSDSDELRVAEDELGKDDETNIVITESKELCLSIDESITSLMKLSIQIHKSSRRAKFAKSSTNKNYDVGPDIGHVREIFPFAASNDSLIGKLGKANAQRRQWLWYRRRHYEKLAVDGTGTSDEPIQMWRGVEPSDIGSMAMVSNDGNEIGSLATLTETKATTFVGRSVSGLDTISVSQLDPTETIFGRSSLANEEEPKLLVPELPKSFVANQPFQCPYCCEIIEISGKNSWQKHVHSDLSSYVCTFKNCDEAFFESRHRWFDHEMEVHRKEWICDICNSRHLSARESEYHLRAEHADQILPEQVSAIVKRFGRPLKYLRASDCPLCDYPMLLRRRNPNTEAMSVLTVERFSQHLGRHLEQLALFVLPENALAYEQNDGVNSDAEAEDGCDECDSDTEEPRLGSNVISEEHLIENLTLEISRNSSSPEFLTNPPELAMKWQPPHDFTPPESDFDTDDVDLLPLRQEPIYGGDLFTPGWARGSVKQKEGYCARCPVGHWVNISNGNYEFHLTYFHGVPSSGVPLPRPSTIRKVQGETNVWEGFCEACNMWKVLKKTKRGWNWHRHWLDDHNDIITARTEAILQGASPENLPLQGASPGNLPLQDSASISSIQNSVIDPEELGRLIKADPNLLNDESWMKSQLTALAKIDKPEPIQIFLRHLESHHLLSNLRKLTNCRDVAGETALMIASSQGQSEIVQTLLNYGADPNLVSPNGRTALDFAANAGYFVIANTLLRAGAEMSKSKIFLDIFSDKQKYSGEMTAEKDSKDSPESINIATSSKLGRAAFEGDIATVRQLLGEDDNVPGGCDTEEGEECGLTAFLLASTKYHLEIMELLLAHGANINVTSKHGWTPLMLATKRNDERCVLTLLSHGADVNHLSPDRWTALAEATSKGYSGIMKILLSSGADTNTRSQHDWTPLMHAAYRGDIDAVNLLLESGASLDETSTRDATATLLAAAVGSATVVKRLLEAGCAPDSEWSKARSVESGKAESRESLIQQRIERVYQVGWTPLMLACQSGSLEIVQILLEAGANPEPRSPMFKTALEIAKENGRTDVVEYLGTRLEL